MTNPELLRGKISRKNHRITCRNKLVLGFISSSLCALLLCDKGSLQPTLRAAVHLVQNHAPGGTHEDGVGQDIDYCQGDPLLRITESPSCKNSDSVLLFVSSLSPNPFHALHDVAWAVSFYMQNCISNKRKTFTFINATAYTPSVTLYDPTFCLARIPNSSLTTGSMSHTELRALYPKWGSCLLHYMAVSVGIPEENILSSSRAGTAAPSCVRKTVHFGYGGGHEKAAGFRGTRWLGRRMTKGQRGQTLPPSTPALVALSPSKKEAAFSNLARSVLSAISPQILREPRSDPLVHVLVFDRSDARARIWIDANVTYSFLKQDSRLLVRWVRHNPKTFAAQAKIYLWADVVVAPHGANMANTLFMQQGGEIIEIWQCCSDNIRANPPKEHWTLWHSRYIGLGHRFIQCHDSRFETKGPGELHNGSLCKHEVPHVVNGIVKSPHIVHVRVLYSDVRDALRDVIPAMVARARNLYVDDLKRDLRSVELLSACRRSERIVENSDPGTEKLKL